MASFISHAQDVIWGAGNTELAALNAAAACGGEDIESLDTAPATDRLIAAITALSGGHPVFLEDIKWEIKQGRADLCQ